MAGVESDKKQPVSVALPVRLGKQLGKASVTRYCIKFKTMKDISVDVLEDAVRFGFQNK